MRLRTFSISSYPEPRVSPLLWRPGTTASCIVLDVLRLRTKTKRVVSTEVMAGSILALFCVLFSAYFSPNLGDKVLSLTDIDFEDKVFGSSTHFVMFYGPW